MMKKNSKTSYSVFILLFSFGISFFPDVTKAQMGGLVNTISQMGGSLNIQGVGPVALSCAKEAGLLSGLPFGGGGGNPGDPNTAGGGGGGSGGGTTNPNAADPNAAGGGGGSGGGQGGGSGAGGGAGGADGVDGAGGGQGQNGGGGQNANPGNMGGQTVPTSNPIVDKAIGVIQENTTTIKTEEQKMTKKERCEDKLARYMVLQVMDKITFSTLEWINSGFEGKPFFVQNPGQFFGDIAAKEILGFTASISGDATLFPFGKTLAETILVSLRNTAQQNMMNSLNNVLAHGTRAEWEYDFSVGGWAGYTAYVEPNNNIFGSYIESSQVLGRKLFGTSTSTAINFQRELEQGLGFLSKRYCAKTESGGTYIPENSIQHTVAGVSEITEINQIPTNVYEYITACGQEIYDEDGDGQADSDGMCMGLDDDAEIIAVAEGFRARSRCLNWQTSTPGHQIAQQTTKALGMSQDQLLLADEINENLGLIFDALINQLISKGLDSFYNSSGTYTADNNSAWAQINGFNPGEQEDAVPFTTAISGGIINGTDDSEGGNFPGFIALQEEYIQKSATLISRYQEKIRRIRDLDYCIPGPNPGWQTIAAQQGAVLLEQIPILESTPSETWGGAQFFDPMGVFDGIGESLETTAYYNNVNLGYSVIIENLTGVSINDGNVDPQIINRNQQVFPIFYQAFEKYANFINTRFINANDFDDNLRSRAATLFFQIDDVQYSIGQYQNIVQTVSQTLEDLIELREEYAVIEHAYILQYLQSAVDQGITSLSDNLTLFETFDTPGEITYIGTNGQNSAYHNAVNALTTEVGEPVVPPISNPQYAEILEDFVQLLQNAVTQEDIDNLEETIEEVIEEIGDPTEENSLIGLVYSCIGQLNSQNLIPIGGEDYSDPDNQFQGFKERKAYPFTLSPDIPGLSNLPTTATFLEDIKASSSPSAVTIGITPASAVSASPDLEDFETNFINAGGSLY